MYLQDSDAQFRADCTEKLGLLPLVEAIAAVSSSRAGSFCGSRSEGGRRTAAVLCGAVGTPVRGFRSCPGLSWQRHSCACHFQHKAEDTLLFTRDWRQDPSAVWHFKPNPQRSWKGWRGTKTTSRARWRSTVPCGASVAEEVRLAGALWMEQLHPAPAGFTRVGDSCTAQKHQHWGSGDTAICMPSYLTSKIMRHHTVPRATRVQFFDVVFCSLHFPCVWGEKELL